MKKSVAMAYRDPFFSTAASMEATPHIESVAAQRLNPNAVIEFSAQLVGLIRDARESDLTPAQHRRLEALFDAFDEIAKDVKLLSEDIKKFVAR